jgi:hypothetical protein
MDLKTAADAEQNWKGGSYYPPFFHDTLLNHEAGENIAMTVKKNHHEKRGHDH